MTQPGAMELVWPAAEYLPGYVEALMHGWSPNNVRPEAGREELDEIERNSSRNEPVVILSKALSS